MVRKRDGLGVEFRKGNLFLEFDKLIEAVGKEAAVRMRAIGANLRTRMRRSLKRRKRASAPGTPPHAHAPGGSGLKAVRFKYDRKDMNLVVGSIKYGDQNQSRPAPNIHEFGGSVRQFPLRSISGLRMSRSFRTGAAAKTKPASYPKQRRERNQRLKLPPDMRIDRRSGRIRDRNTGRLITKAEYKQVVSNSSANFQKIQNDLRTRKVAFYRPRPYARPVLEKAIAERLFPRQFQNLIGGL
jgi:hypothetical protein